MNIHVVHADTDDVGGYRRGGVNPLPIDECRRDEHAKTKSASCYIIARPVALTWRAAGPGSATRYQSICGQFA